MKENYKEHFHSFIESARNILEIGSLYKWLFKLVLYKILHQEEVFLVYKLIDDGKLGSETTITLESLKEIFFNNISTFIFEHFKKFLLI